MREIEDRNIINIMNEMGEGEDIPCGSFVLGS
jgi:hypothetical protein